MEALEIQRQIIELKKCIEKLREMEERNMNYDKTMQIKKEDRPKVKKLGVWKKADSILKTQL